MEARRRTAVTTIVGEQELLTFAGCDYLGLAHHDAITKAALAGIQTHGLSAGASRTTTGETGVFTRLEASLAGFSGFDAATLVPEGFLANIAALQALRDGRAIALLDARSHQSQADAARAAGLRVERFAHLDADDAARRANEFGPQSTIIVTDGVFAADGAVAPLAHLLERTAAPILLDDCHGFGILGPRGRGTAEHFGIAGHPRITVTTTLAKTFGVYGGAILASRDTTRHLRASASAFICTTPIPPALAKALIASLEVHRCELDRLARLRRNIGAVADALEAAGLHERREVPTPIFAFARESAEATRDLAGALLERNILVPAIAYPGGPADVYCRLAVSSQHEPEHIELLAQALQDALAEAA